MLGGCGCPVSLSCGGVSQDWLALYGDRPETEAVARREDTPIRIQLRGGRAVAVGDGGYCAGRVAF